METMNNNVEIKEIEMKTKKCANWSHIKPISEFINEKGIECKSYNPCRKTKEVSR